MSQIYFTSDTHFGHDKPFLYEPRGFQSIQEHDEIIIENWNKIVKPEDIVYHLGDIMLNNDKHGIDCLSKLNGHIKIIRGNHDTENRWALYNSLQMSMVKSNTEEYDYSNTLNIEPIGYADMLIYKKWHLYLSHYPTMVGGDFNMHDKLFCLCGHSHTKDKFQDIKIKSYHCELDAHNNYPVSIEEVLEDIRGYLHSEI